MSSFYCGTLYIRDFNTIYIMGKNGLLPGEKIVYKTYISRVANLYYYVIVGALILIGAYIGFAGSGLLGINPVYLTSFFVLIGVVCLLYFEIKRSYHKYILTDRRIIKKSGILKSELTAWELRQVINLKIHQSLMGRLTGFGTVDVVLTGNNNLFLESVRHPERLMSMIEELVEEKTSEIKLTK